MKGGLPAHRDARGRRVFRDQRKAGSCVHACTRRERFAQPFTPGHVMMPLGPAIHRGDGSSRMRLPTAHVAIVRLFAAACAYVVATNSTESTESHRIGHFPGASSQCAEIHGRRADARLVASAGNVREHVAAEYVVATRCGPGRQRVARVGCVPGTRRQRLACGGGMPLAGLRCSPARGRICRSRADHHPPGLNRRINRSLVATPSASPCINC